MQYPNALSGVKKIYKAEIFALIGTIIMVLASLFSLISLNAGSAGGFMAGVLGAGAFVIIAAVLYIIGFILNIVGLNAAKSDEDNFKNALIVVIVGLIASVVLGFAKEGSYLKDCGQTVGNICSFLTTYFVCSAIINLAQSLGNTEMFNRGVSARKLLMIVWMISIILQIVPIITKAIGSVAVGVAGILLSLAAFVFQIVVYFIYLKLLSRARTMLAA